MARRIILNTLLLTAVFACMSFCLSNVLIKGRPVWAYLNSSIVLKGGQAFHMTTELDTIKLPDNGYYIFGSSHAYRGYDPAYFAKAGIEVFNGGSSGQSLKCSYALMKYYHKKIKHVILDIHPGMFSKQTGESQLILMQGTPDFNLAMNLFFIKINTFTVNNMLYRILRLKDEPLHSEEGYRGKGYSYTDKELGNVTIVDQTRQYDEEQYTNLIEIINYCKEKDIDLTLVSHPLPLPDEKITSFWLFKSRARKISEQYSVPFFDYTYKYDLDNSYFMDINHLNYKGVDFFDKQFIHDKFKKSLK